MTAEAGTPRRLYGTTAEEAQNITTVLAEQIREGIWYTDPNPPAGPGTLLLNHQVILGHDAMRLFANKN